MSLFFFFFGLSGCLPAPVGTAVCVRVCVSVCIQLCRIIGSEDGKCFIELMIPSAGAVR